MDHSQAQYFATLFDVEEVVDIKNDIHSQGPSAMGWDRTSYELFMAIPNDLLVTFFNRCLESRGAPRMWLVTVLIGDTEAREGWFQPSKLLLDWPGIMPSEDVHTTT